MTHQEELRQLYVDAIAIAEEWRFKRPPLTATPNELRLYNIFTIAKSDLQANLARIEDVMGVYNDGSRNE